MLTEFYSSRTLRNLVLSSSDGAAVPFVELLWARVFKDRCQQFVGEHPTVAKGIMLCNATKRQHPVPTCDFDLQAIMQRRCLQPCWSAGVRA